MSNKETSNSAENTVIPAQDRFGSTENPPDKSPIIFP